MPERTDILSELYNRRKLPQEKLAILDELKNRGKLDQGLLKLASNDQFIASIKQTPQEEEPGVLDQLWQGWKGGAETAATLATGAIAEPVSGIAGLAKTITSGPEAGAETIEQIQEAMTYQPRTKAGQNIISGLGQGIEAVSKAPGVKQVGQAFEATKDKALEIGGPGAATVIATLPALALELLGLKGTRAAKKAVLKKSIKDLDKTSFYDETGTLSPNVKNQIKQSGLDISDVEDFLPESITTQQAAEPLAKKIDKAESKLGIGESRRIASLAEQVKPDLERIKAFDELEVDYLPSYVSQNPTYAAIEQNLQTVPGSMLATKQKAITAELSKKADEIITEGGGEIDKGLVSDRFRKDSKKIIDDLGEMSSDYYKTVTKNLPPKTRIETNNIIDEIQSVADDLGGIEYLDPKERRLLKVLDQETKPTYARLDKYRKQIGDAMRGKESPFKDSDHRTLSRLYKAMTNDQESALLKIGDESLLTTYLTGKNLTAQRKGIEKQLTEILGKDLTGEVSKKLKPAILDLQKGYAARFDNIIDNIPDELGKEAKASVLHTALNDAFVQGSRAERSLNIAGFDDWMKGLKRHPKVYSRLKNELGNKTIERLETLHTVVNSVRDAQKLAVLTGRTISTPGLFDETRGIARRFYGVSKSFAGKIPLVGGFFKDMVGAEKNVRSISADKLLSGMKFRNLLKQKILGKIDTPAREANVNRLIEKIDAFKNWKDNLPPKDLNDLNKVGAIGYLSGEMLEPQEEPKQ